MRKTIPRALTPQRATPLLHTMYQTSFDTLLYSKCLRCQCQVVMSNDHADPGALKYFQKCSLRSSSCLDVDGTSCLDVDGVRNIGCCWDSASFIRQARESATPRIAELVLTKLVRNQPKINPAPRNLSLFLFSSLFINMVAVFMVATVTVTEVSMSDKIMFWYEQYQFFCPPLAGIRV